MSIQSNTTVRTNDSNLNVISSHVPSTNSYTSSHSSLTIDTKPEVLTVDSKTEVGIKTLAFTNSLNGEESTGATLDGLLLRNSRNKGSQATFDSKTIEMHNERIKIPDNQSNLKTSSLRFPSDMPSLDNTSAPEEPPLTHVTKFDPSNLVVFNSPNANPSFSWLKTSFPPTTPKTPLSAINLSTTIEEGNNNLTNAKSPKQCKSTTNELKSQGSPRGKTKSSHKYNSKGQRSQEESQLSSDVQSKSSMDNISSSSSSSRNKRDREGSYLQKHLPLPSFLRKAYQIISTDRNGVVGWSPKGDSFTIYNSERFASEYLPKYFKHNKFYSFIRQLNFYGFRKIKEGKRQGQGGQSCSGTPVSKVPWKFRHPYFQKGKPHLLILIKRGVTEEYRKELQEREFLKDIAIIQNSSALLSRLENDLDELDMSTHPSIAHLQRKSSFYDTPHMINLKDDMTSVQSRLDGMISRLKEMQELEFEKSPYSEKLMKDIMEEVQKVKFQHDRLVYASDDIAPTTPVGTQIQANNPDAIATTNATTVNTPTTTPTTTATTRINHNSNEEFNVNNPFPVSLSLSMLDPNQQLNLLSMKEKTGDDNLKPIFNTGTDLADDISVISTLGSSKNEENERERNKSASPTTNSSNNLPHHWEALDHEKITSFLGKSNYNSSGALLHGSSTSNQLGVVSVSSSFSNPDELIKSLTTAYDDDANTRNNIKNKRNNYDYYQEVEVEEEGEERNNNLNLNNKYNHDIDSSNKVNIYHHNHHHHMFLVEDDMVYDNMPHDFEATDILTLKGEKSRSTSISSTLSNDEWIGNANDIL